MEERQGTEVLSLAGAMSWVVRRRRRFWCAQTRREVEVEFEEHGLPGLRWQGAVLSCSIFEPPTRVAYGRRCLSSAFRRQWPSPLPVGEKR